MTQVIILHLTRDGHEQVVSFHSLRKAYDWLQQTTQRLFPNDPTFYIEQFDYIANEICERFLIGQGQLIPTAWNETKTWKASLAKTYIVEEQYDLIS
jgi:hypothetical protein